jgi:hypothetical protein
MTNFMHTGTNLVERWWWRWMAKANIKYKIRTKHPDKWWRNLILQNTRDSDSGKVPTFLESKTKTLHTNWPDGLWWDEVPHVQVQTNHSSAHT